MDILKTGNIAINVSEDSQQAIFNKIAELAIINGYGTHQEEIVKGLQQREAESTTGMMDGFAIPHTQNKEIKEPGIIILSLEKGVEWDSLDGQMITFVVALLIPAGKAGTTHLQLLSKVARMLMRENIKKELKEATSTQQIFEVITKQIV